MKVLVDTHAILWWLVDDRRLSKTARRILEDSIHSRLVSFASLWEIAIKRTLGRPDFRVEPRLLRRGLIDNGTGR